jgi:hypothetical protein
MSPLEELMFCFIVAIILFAIYIGIGDLFRLGIL